MNTIESNRTAVLVMDYQADIVTMLGDKAAPCLERARAVLAAARAAQLPDHHLSSSGSSSGYPEFDPRNAAFANVTKTGRFVTTSPGADIVAAVRPHDGDVIVTKHRVGAFFGTISTSACAPKRIETLVLLGFSTSGVVLSTVRHGADAAELIIVKDCCAGRRRRGASRADGEVLRAPRDGRAGERGGRAAAAGVSASRLGAAVAIIARSAAPTRTSGARVFWTARQQQRAFDRGHGVGEALVVAEIEIGFRTVVGHEDLAMLERTHGPRSTFK